jgi:hypothetical protein
LVVGLLITVGLAISSAISYDNNEKRLNSLQTRLTASVLQTAQPQLQSTLGRVVGLTAATRDPVTTFRAAMASELSPAGPFASATLAVVQSGQVHVLDHVGSAPLQGLDSNATTALFLQASRTSSLVTTRVVSAGVQKLGYLLSVKAAQGVYVVGAAQQLPAGDRVSVPAGSPDSNLNFALYFGRSTNPESLIETNARTLPLSGTVSQATVPFGNNVLTLVASPRGSLAGTWAEYLPWAILGLGMLISIAGAAVADNLVRRRRSAEALYRQQRSVSETLQRSLLPRTLPQVAGWDFAARYVPATKGAEIGGDWYSVVEIDDHRFAVVIGDVSGHDVAAAGVMAALRYTIRTLAKMGVAPDEILVRTNRELDVVADSHFATVLVGVVDTVMQEMTLASAGHPPPLLLRDGRTEFVNVPPGVPLGIRGDRRPEPVTFDLLPGTTLVAFTDGLVEKRGESLDARLSQLAAVATRSPSKPNDLITGLLGELTDGDQEDDIAILAIRFSDEESGLARRESPQSTALTLSQPSPS